MSALAQAVDRRMLGRYEIVAEIARGGMGTVYLARLEGVGGFQRLSALKLLHRHLADEAQFVTMLLDEARLAARLHHPNAVGIVDVAKSELGYYVVMEYVDGFSLEQLLDRLPPPGADDGPEVLKKRVSLALRVLLDAARGLNAAHELTDDEGRPLGIVHRDVSPQNVLVGKDGVGRITDFGVARAAARITSSHPGMIKGKPCYMAPEQARGDDDLDARADVFALGIMLWELLVGRMLFQCPGGPAVTLSKVLHGEIPRPRDEQPAIPEAIEAVCLKALERDLDARYGSARAFGEALEAAARGAGWLASPNELADAMRVLFAEDFRDRRKAIRAHLEALEELGNAAEMHEADLNHVPRLKSAPRVSRVPGGALDGEPWHETPDPRDQQPTRSGIRVSRVDDEVAHAETISSEVPAAAVTPAPMAGAERTRGVPWRWALGLGFVGAAMLAAAIMLWPRRATGTEEAGEAAAFGSGAPEVGEAAEASEGEVEGAEPVERVEPSGAGEDETLAEASENEVRAEPAARAEADGREARAARRARREQARRAAAMDAPETTMDAPSGPALEDNPYLR